MATEADYIKGAQVCAGLLKKEQAKSRNMFYFAVVGLIAGAVSLASQLK